MRCLCQRLDRGGKIRDQLERKTIDLGRAWEAVDWPEVDIRLDNCPLRMIQGLMLRQFCWRRSAKHVRTTRSHSWWCWLSVLDIVTSLLLEARDSATTLQGNVMELRSGVRKASTGPGGRNAQAAGKAVTMTRPRLRRSRLDV